MTHFSEQFAAAARRSPQTVHLDGVDYVVRATNAQSGLVRAFLEVVTPAGEVIGYFTEYGLNESGVVRPALFGVTMPTIVRTVEDGIQHLLP